MDDLPALRDMVRVRYKLLLVSASQPGLLGPILQRIAGVQALS